MGLNEGGGVTPEEIEAASITELEHGRLPVRAQERLAMMRADQAFTSDLSVQGHHAIRSVGFSPVGQVLGSCVYHTLYTRSWNCNSPSYNTRITGPVPEVDELENSYDEAWRIAVDRMRQECVGLGGDGVVGVIVVTEPFPAGGFEVRVLGTAVRADGPVRARHPFMSDLSGQDFAKLIRAGWVPCGLVVANAVAIRHDHTLRREKKSLSNRELAWPTRTLTAARSRARERLVRAVARTGGAGVVIREPTVELWEQRCGRVEGEDLMAQVTIIGTSIVDFHTDHTTPPLTITRLR